MNRLEGETPKFCLGGFELFSLLAQQVTGRYYELDKTFFQYALYRGSKLFKIYSR
ncbi:hypothetical protein ACSU1N_03845 [Thermogladius sp. 4427co]|uniref:hypothetical protein n=1 Tax=Thermogladius sp. 4427co TaxID=3450718 RepID=UPI003F79AFD8